VRRQGLVLRRVSVAAESFRCGGEFPLRLSASLSGGQFLACGGQFLACGGSHLVRRTDFGVTDCFRHGFGAAEGAQPVPFPEEMRNSVPEKSVAGSRCRDFSEKGFLSLQPDFCGDHPTETDCES